MTAHDNTPATGKEGNGRTTEQLTDGGTPPRDEVDVARVPDSPGVFIAVRPENLGNDILTLLLNVEDATELRDKLDEQLEGQDDD